MNIQNVIGFSAGAAKRTISELVSKGDLSTVVAFLSHPMPGVQHRASLALGANEGIEICDGGEGCNCGTQILTADNSCANCHGAEDLQPGTLDGKPILVCLNCRENPVETSLPDFAALASEYGEPDASILPGLYAAKGNDSAALRRSLSARRANRAKVKKAPEPAN